MQSNIQARFMFTFMHLGDAFIQSDFQCIANTMSHRNFALHKINHYIYKDIEYKYFGC